MSDPEEIADLPPKNYEDLVDAIQSSGLSAVELRDLNSIVIDEIKIADGRNVAKLRRYLSVGDMIKTHGLRPKSANGRIYKVIKINKTRIVVDIDGRETTVPISCITKV